MRDRLPPARRTLLSIRIRSSREYGSTWPRGRILITLNALTPRLSVPTGPVARSGSQTGCRLERGRRAASRDSFPGERRPNVNMWIRVRSHSRSRHLERRAAKTANPRPIDSCSRYVLIAHGYGQELPQLPRRHEARNQDTRILIVRVSEMRVREDRSREGKCAARANCPQPPLTGDGRTKSRCRRAHAKAAATN